MIFINHYNNFCSAFISYFKEIVEKHNDQKLKEIFEYIKYINSNFTTEEKTEDVLKELPVKGFEFFNRLNQLSNK